MSATTVPVLARWNITPTHNQNSQISLYPETPTSRWAILLPNEEADTVTVDAVGYDNIDIIIPPVHKNDFLHGENAVRFELTAMMADDPLTMMAFEPGTIYVSDPSEGMKYSINYGEKELITGDIEISVNPGEEVCFYGNGTNGSTNIGPWMLC